VRRKRGRKMMSVGSVRRRRRRMMMMMMSVGKARTKKNRPV
jgi:hypothetical protein